MDPLADLRRSAYKARSHFKPEEVRRRRETAQVELRKQKKEENLAKRRNLKAEALPDDSDEDVDITSIDAQVRLKILRNCYLLKQRTNVTLPLMKSSWIFCLNWCKMCTRRMSRRSLLQLLSSESCSLARRTLPSNKSLLAVLFRASSNFCVLTILFCRQVSFTSMFRCL